uniref:sarcolemmal membrane-associated protein-like n=1 Tax=Myxine glutinosa TaxID=7769 RepID=UPI00358F5B86
MENSRKVTHSCIISTIKLFLEDGTEARTRTEVSPSSLEKVLPTQANVCSQEMYQISQLLKEALHREQMLEQKLATLQRLLASTQEASENSWQALIDEDRLLSRLEVLEHQLQVYAVKSLPEESLRKELSQLLEDKLNYETTAKESLWRVLQEKLAAARKLAEHERALSNAEDECTHLREAYENAQEELSELASQYDDTRTQLADLGDKMKLSIEQQEILELEAGEEKQKLQSVISELKQREAALQACVEALQADTDFTREQLTAVKAKLEQMQEKRVKENPVIGGTVDEISSKMNGRIDEEHISTAGSDNCTDLLQQIIQFQIRLSRSADSNLLLDDEQKEAKAKLKALLDVAQKKLMFSNIEDESAAVNVKTDVQPVGLSPNKEVLKVRQDKMEHKLETAFKELDQLRGRKEMRETTINSEVVNVIDAVHAGIRIVPEVVVEEEEEEEEEDEDVDVPNFHAVSYEPLSPDKIEEYADYESGSVEEKPRAEHWMPESQQTLKRKPQIEKAREPDKATLEQCLLLKAKLEEDCHASAAKMESYQRELARLQSLLEVAQAELVTLHSERVARENGTQHEQETLRDEMQQLRKKAEMAEKNRIGEIARLQEQLTGVTEALEHSRMLRNQEDEDRQQKMEEFSKRLEEEQAKEVTELQVDLQRIRKECSELREANRAAHRCKVDFRRQLEHLQEQLDSAEERGAALRTEVSRLEAARSDLAMELEQERREQQDVAELRSMLDKLEETANVNSREADQCRHEAGSWRERYETAWREKDELKAEVSQCRTHLQSLEDEANKKTWSKWMPLVCLVVAMTVAILYPTLS